MVERLNPTTPAARTDSLQAEKIMNPDTNPSLLDQAISLAVDAHRGQFDEAGAPYILHPLRVMLTQSDDTRRIAAVLHDVVEDCGVTAEDLRARFGAAVADAVMALTRRDEDYDAFIARCMRHPVARDVKRADIMDNLDLSRLSEVTERDEARAAKYRRALAQLDAMGWS
jgi:(p)ppGpp synthase/HD superfamily hydrolase